MWIKQGKHSKYCVYIVYIDYVMGEYHAGKVHQGTMTWCTLSAPYIYIANLCRNTNIITVTKHFHYCDNFYDLSI